jgi:transcriptional regulator of acetoin/glycerol metabolism
MAEHLAFKKLRAQRRAGNHPERFVRMMAPGVDGPARRTGLDGLVWDEARARALARAGRLLDADVPVLVQGETGTGKEVFARALHAASARAARPFVAVNCAALPEGLIEAELFGYEEGAFTGARRKGAKGLMREADGGVLFLDEIGDMPIALQARLLRALQEREVTPLGGGRPVAVDFALVCATHRRLADAVAAGDFRQDLYFRIAQYTVELAPLRGRPDLAAVIAELWAAQAARAEGVSLTTEVVDRLVAHDWPGNFRQLTTLLRTLAILAEPGEALTLDALPADLRAPAPPAQPAAAPMTARATALADDPPERLDAITLAAMRTTIVECGGNLSRAAARLGVHRSTLYRRLAGRDARPAEG